MVELVAFLNLDIQYEADRRKAFMVLYNIQEACEVIARKLKIETHLHPRQVTIPIALQCGLTFCKYIQSKERCSEWQALIDDWEHSLLLERCIGHWETVSKQCQIVHEIEERVKLPSDRSKYLSIKQLNLIRQLNNDLPNVDLLPKEAVKIINRYADYDIQLQEEEYTSRELRAFTACYLFHQICRKIKGPNCPPKSTTYHYRFPSICEFENSVVDLIGLTRGRWNDLFMLCYSPLEDVACQMIDEKEWDPWPVDDISEQDSDEGEVIDWTDEDEDGLKTFIIIKTR